MLKKYIYISIATFLFSISSVIAQSDYSNQVTVDNVVEKKNNEVKLKMNFILDKLHLKSAHMLILTPVLESEDKTQRKQFAPIVLTGRNKQKSLNRSNALGNESPFATEPYLIRRHYNNSTEDKDISYNISVPYESWMPKGRLILDEEVLGCADCDLGKDQLLLRHPLLKEPYKPVFTPNFIVPKVEEIKIRNEVQELRLNYKVAKWDVLPDFAGNAAELNKFAELYNSVKSNPDLKFTGVEILGFASPEGTYKFNMTLSENRAKSLASYLQKKHNLNSNFFTLDWKGEDWPGLVEALKTYDVQDKDQILQIIRTIEDPEKRKTALKALSGGAPYKKMLAEIYPPLRRNKVTVNYNVNPFNLERAREVIKTNPKLLSLNEMYLVANSYPKGSPEYNEVFATAARLYPDSPEAVVNAAASQIEDGNFDEALRILTYGAMKDAPEIWNNLGVVMANRKNYKEAKEYFSKASQNGVSEARRNLDELNKALEDLDE